MRGKGLATLATFLVQLYITTYMYAQCCLAWLALCKQVVVTPGAHTVAVQCSVSMVPRL